MLLCKIGGSLANHKKPENEKVVALCGSVRIPVKKVILDAALSKGVSPASFVGMILSDWVVNHTDSMIRYGETRDTSAMGEGNS